MKNFKKILFLILLSFLFSENIFAFEKEKCSKDLILHQNLRALKKGYVKNGKYDRYTNGIVKEAKILQRHLNRLWFNAGKIDGVIGPKTREAILRLQKYLGTKQDGYVGPKTRALLNNSCGKKKDAPGEHVGLEDGGDGEAIATQISAILSKGLTNKMTGGEVSKLQKILGIKADGIFGPGTEATLKKWTKNKLGYELNYFDPRLFEERKNWTKKNYSPKKIKEFLGYGTFDWFYLDFPFEKEKIDSIYCGAVKKDFIFKNQKIIFPLSNQGKGKFICKLNTKLDRKNKSFEIVEVGFRTIKRPTTHVNLIKKYTGKTKPETIERIKREKKELAKTYQNADKKLKFNSPFINPLSTKIISPFGKTRIFNNVRKSIHSGTDFRARTPLPIKAVNDGEVIWANKELYYCGKGIIINHGMNLFSVYCHLSANEIKVGDKIKKGQTIGLTGATGRVSGPHLHLSMKYNGGYIDFEELQKKSEIVFEK